MPPKIVPVLAPFDGNDGRLWVMPRLWRVKKPKTHELFYVKREYFPPDEKIPFRIVNGRVNNVEGRHVIVPVAVRGNSPPVHLRGQDYVAMAATIFGTDITDYCRRMPFIDHADHNIEQILENGPTFELR